MSRGVRSSTSSRDLTGVSKSMSSKDPNARNPGVSDPATGGAAVVGAASACRNDHGWSRRAESRARLSANHAEHEACGGSHAHPGGRHAMVGPVSFVHPVLTRERDDARRLIELFEPAENLGLLERQSLGREGGVGRLDAGRPDVVHPAAEIDGALGADVASIEMRRPVAGEQRVDERALGKVSSTKQPVTEPHD